MMKIRILLVIISCSFLLASCSQSIQIEENQTEHISHNTQKGEQIRAVWLSCYELSAMLSEGSQEYFYDKISETFELCVNKNINTLFVQVRPFYDALYQSEIFEWSKYAKSSSGKIPGFDPLKIIVDVAEVYGVSIHAWINPYRVSYNSSNETALAIGSFAFCCDEGVFLDPSNVESQKKVLDGVREILNNYDIEGIHIDDYFYPPTNENFDKDAYNAYRDRGGKLSKNNWRRENVNSLVSALYSLVHSIKHEAVFSISPAGDIGKNKNFYYADVELWCTVNGYADWIIPQIYYGFEHEKMPFEKIAEKWKRLSEKAEIKLICGLASYKQGKHDKGAGSGEKEWVEADDVIDRQIDYVNSIGYDGYSLFSLSSLK